MMIALFYWHQTVPLLYRYRAVCVYTDTAFGVGLSWQPPHLMSLTEVSRSEQLSAGAPGCTGCMSTGAGGAALN